MSQTDTHQSSSGRPDEANAFELDKDVDAKFKAEQKALDERTPAEYEAVLKHLEETAKHFKETIPDFVCHLTRDSQDSSTFVYKETTSILKLVKAHLAERGRDWALHLTMANGKENNYRPYPHEEGLVWICDHQSGEDLVGTSKDFAAKIVEKCSRA